MDNSKMYLIPPLVIDRAEGMLKAKTKESAVLYAQTLETIRDYCNEMLERHQKRNFDDERKPRRKSA